MKKSAPILLTLFAAICLAGCTAQPSVPEGETNNLSFSDDFYLEPFDRTEIETF